MSQVENATPVVGVKQVLAMLNEGKTRKEIAQHYGRTEAEMNATVWQHPELKGKKVKKQYTLVVVEDEEQAGAELVEQDTPIAEVAETTQEDTFQEEEVVVDDQPVSQWNNPENDAVN